MKRRSLIFGLLFAPLAAPVAAAASKVAAVAPNPLNFGNMVWAPELVLLPSVSRGQTSCIQVIDELPFTRPDQQDGLQHVLASKHYLYDNDVASMYWQSTPDLFAPNKATV